MKNLRMFKELYAKSVTISPNSWDNIGYLLNHIRDMKLAIFDFGNALLELGLDILARIISLPIIIHVTCAVIIPFSLLKGNEESNKRWLDRTRIEYDRYMENNHNDGN